MKIRKLTAFLLILILVFPCSVYGSTADVTISNNSAYDEDECTSADYSNLLGSENGIEIYGRKNLTYDIPAEGMMEVILLIKNTNDYAVRIDQGSDFDVTNDNFSGSILNYCSDFTVITHPNGSDFVIEATSELTYIFDISLPNFNNMDKSIDCDLAFTYDFKVYDNENGSSVADIEIAVNSDINYIGKSERSKDKNRNATIKGIVIDSDSNPVKNVEIEVFNVIDEGIETIKTDSEGKFELKVTAHKSADTSMWHECVLRFKHADFDEKYICVYPKTGETNEVKVTLSEPSEKLVYTKEKTIDLGIQAYSYDIDKGKSLICFTPFHSGLDYANIKDKVNLTYTDFDGNILFSYHLNAETPWVCVSDDGEYVVTNQAVNEGDESSTSTVVLNKKGETVYQKSFEGLADTPEGYVPYILQSRCAELSHDNKYLIVGSGEGEIWALDWKNDKVLWSAKSHGQVRNILFSDDNSTVIISSGDGYIYGFDVDGNQLFKTYVGSWATCMELADNYLVYGLKTAWGSNGCIDITTGEKLWVNQALARGSDIAVSKDKKYVWMGNDVSSSYSSINNAIYDISTGEIAYILDCDSAQQAMYSDDGKYLVVKNSRKVQVFETENYSLVWEKTVVEGDDINAASINQTVAVNDDASRIVTAFNTDSSERCYGQAYYFAFSGKKLDQKKISDIADRTYTGSSIKPSVSVKGLKKGIDYTVSYSNNVKVGIGSVKITGIGDYTGTVTKKFTIKPKTSAVKSLVSGKKKLTVKATTKPSSKGGSYYQIGYKMKGSSKWKYTTTSSSSKTIKSLKKGKYYYVKVRCLKKVSGKTYYGAWSKAKLSKKIK